MTKHNHTQSLIDVRTPEEYKGGHIEGAINIPLDQVPHRLDEINELPKPIIAYCRSGNRSDMAVRILKQSGIEPVVNGGGITDLKKTISLMRSLINGWTVGRALRLIVGLAALVQAILQKDPVYGLLAVFLLGTAAANIGCGGAGCSVHSKTMGTEKINYEELDSKK